MSFYLAWLSPCLAKKKVQQVRSSCLKKVLLWRSEKILFAKLDVLFLCQHYFSVLRASSHIHTFFLILHLQIIIPYALFFFPFCQTPSLYTAFACKIGTSDFSAGNLFTTSVSCFQVKWIPKRASEEKARYEGLMLLAGFL